MKGCDIMFNDFYDDDKKLKQKRVIELYRMNLKQTQMDRWFEVFMNSGRFPELEDEQDHFAKLQFWEKGGVAVWVNYGTDELDLAPFSTNGWKNRYLAPTNVTLINLASAKDVPTKALKLNKEVVLIWYSPNHQPLRKLVETYVDRIVQIEMIINSNLMVQNMPFILKGDKSELKKLKELVSQILNGELVITADIDGMKNLEILNTNAPLIIKDLYSYKKDLENELLTYLGFNNIAYEKKERLIADEANANNEFIEASDDVHTDEIKRGCKRVTKYLGHKLSYISKFEELEAKNEQEEGDEDVDLSNDRE